MRLTFLTGIISAVATVVATGLTEVTNYGPNPTSVRFFVYKPTRIAVNPPVLVAIHYCSGTAQLYYSGTQYKTLAEKYGFIVIYPNAPFSNGCWDVHSPQTLTHNQGGDSLGIVSMVRYAIKTWNADTNRVFVTGTSSGAMMTNVLLGAYPDVFKAGAAFSGVPYGCFAGDSMWSSQCAEGKLSKTPEQWGNQVRSGYPGFRGERPKMQVWHGSADTILYPQNFREEVKQWTNVFGYSQTPAKQTRGSPHPNYTWSVYGPKFEAIYATGVGHSVPEHTNEVMRFFGLDVVPAGPGTIRHWGQCGGQGYTGPTSCVSPYTCQFISARYSQCL